MYTNRPIKEEWEDYYKFLEGLRRTGVCNMFGASEVLVECFPELSDEQAQEILVNWMSNYSELDKRYGWRS